MKSKTVNKGFQSSEKNPQTTMLFTKQQIDIMFSIVRG